MKIKFLKEHEDRNPGFMKSFNVSLYRTYKIEYHMNKGNEIVYYFKDNRYYRSGVSSKDEGILFEFVEEDE